MSQPESVHQDNLRAAIRSAGAPGRGLRIFSTQIPNLSREKTEKLQQWVWDLEAVQAVLRLELNDRETHAPIDLG